MGRTSEIRDLEPLERRIATMRAAGMSLNAIAHFLETNEPHVRAVLARPAVQRFGLAMSATIMDGIEKEVVEDLNESIRDTAKRAFEIEKGVMEELYTLGSHDKVSIDAAIRAKLGAAATAQDILDRAGNRAPTKILNAHVSAQIPPEAMETLVKVMSEIKHVLPNPSIEIECSPVD